MRTKSGPDTDDGHPHDAPVAGGSAPRLGETNLTDSGSTALGTTLRNLRRRRGLAQRDLLRPLHLGSHSAIVDYEAGRRIPPAALVAAYEQLFSLPPGTLGRLRDRALAERAAQETGARSNGSGDSRAEDHPPLPRQLPAAPSIFTGRSAELARLDRLLRDRDTSAPVVISSVRGRGGIGKTALAVHWAHLARENFPDGELYIDMRGYHPSGRPMSPEVAVSQFMVALGVAADHVPATMAERSGLFRSLMAGRQMLLLLDNVRDVEQVRPLLPGSPSCRVLITSRSSLSGLAVRDGAQRISLGEMDLRDATRLLRRMIGPAADSQPGAIAALASLCELHPLALRIAAERIARGDPGRVGDVVLQLAESADGLADLAMLEDDTSAVRRVFAWSYQALPEAARRLFRLLGLHDGPDLPLAAAGALVGLADAECAEILGSLADLHLVEEHLPGRYRVHDLLSLFAREVLTREEPAEGRSQAALRVAVWYLQGACAGRPPSEGPRG